MLREKNNFDTNKNAWVVAVDMGYGHQRTAHSLRDIAPNQTVINANSYNGIPARDQKLWDTTRTLYEFISRFRRIPIIGVFLFLFLDRFQKILGYYPKRDLSKSNFSGKNIDRFIKRGWGGDLIGKLAKNPMPFVTTFFSTAFMAEYFNYPNDIYCIICDADIARAWVSLEPKKSRIKYFASNTWTRDRLKLYGVKPENILLTGYPLPKENIGGENLQTLKKDFGYRLLNLDPNGKYQKLYAPLIKNYLGQLPKLPNHPLTILFSIGGAGAQKEVALAIINSLKEKIKAKQLRFIISVGMRQELHKYFADNVKDLDLDGWLHILSGKNTKEYFDEFNRELRTVDILMTKPSELSFYGALGIPIIIEPSIGSQEDFNRRWLLHVGVGTLQENPAYTDQWLYDLLETGGFAEMAMQGFIEMEKLGTYRIEKIIAGKK
ncbi:MAG: hypothetical protein EXS48_00955 [Candidatus Staskawiczbacteria bacterium]|nr:hypothetical protein [Candidatus Staskawiczbacteria bacterium]